MSLYREYMTQLETLSSVKPGSSAKAAVVITFVLIVALGLLLVFTPWVQSARGMGTVTSQQAEERQQAISALVSGRIKQWHVREGQWVKQGDPIVTLEDQDQDLLLRLEAELAAKQRQTQAMLLALKAAEQVLQRKQALLDKGLESVAERDKAQIKVQEIRTKLASTEAEATKASVKLARLSTQTKFAPKDGVITGLYSAGTATAVKAGDVLASFVPKESKRSVVLEVSGMDAPLVHTGRKVRLQFDGWPVIQFSGWPSAAIGTFGGVVDFVEPIANARGNFRVWVSEDVNDPWPDPRFVRLGSRAKGWVLLEEVRLGYEIWRQLNHFPPEYAAVEEKGE